MIEFKLQNLLDSKRISQYELSKMTGGRLATINNICKNRIVNIPVLLIDNICRELECEPTDWICYTPSPKIVIAR